MIAAPRLARGTVSAEDQDPCSAPLVACRIEESGEMAIALPSGLARLRAATLQGRCSTLLLQQFTRSHSSVADSWNLASLARTRSARRKRFLGCGLRRLLHAVQNRRKDAADERSQEVKPQIGDGSAAQQHRD